MDRNEFDAAVTALIRRNWRHLDDLGGQPPAALLDGLWGIVRQHAEDTGVIAVKREDDLPPDDAPKAPPRRTPARRSTRG